MLSLYIFILALQTALLMPLLKSKPDNQLRLFRAIKRQAFEDGKSLKDKMKCKYYKVGSSFAGKMCVSMSTLHLHARTT